MAAVHHGRGYVYSIQYHIVWCVKYSHKILQGEIDTKLKEILFEIAKEQGFEIIAMETNQGHKLNSGADIYGILHTLLQQ